MTTSEYDDLVKWLRALARRAAQPYRIEPRTQGEVKQWCREAADVITRLVHEVATSAEKSDAEMERVKACEHIAGGDEGWEVLRNICPSTAAVARLRDRAEAAEAALSTAGTENASLWVRVESGEAAAHAQGAEEMREAVRQLPTQHDCGPADRGEYMSAAEFKIIALCALPLSASSPGPMQTETNARPFFLPACSRKGYRDQ